MEMRRLGRTDIDVSAICLGTMTWGQQNTEAEGHEQMDYAVDRGINFFDTAEMYAVPPTPASYGRTEEIIGTWFKARGGRERIVLATKIAGPGDMDWVRDGHTRLNEKNRDLCAGGSYPLNLLIFGGDIAAQLLIFALLSRHDDHARMDAGFL